MRLLSLLLVLPVFTAGGQSPSVAGARDPAYGPDARLALSVRGDLWVVSKDAKWVRITAGPAWDREPVWSADGRSLLFSSNRDGRFDIWRVALSDTGAASAPTRVLGSSEDESEPAEGADQQILFVRGRGSAARIWVHEADGREHRLTNGQTAERWPAISADRERVAFVALSESGRRLIVRRVDAPPDRRGSDTTVASAPGIEHPAWSPNGDRLTYTTAAPRSGVYVVPLDGRDTNL